MSVEFQLLGDVEVRLDGQRLETGHARQRCVLVALLVDVNHPVPVDQLLDRVWADQPPRRARNALAGYVSRLRSLLAGAGNVQICREPGGYLLRANAFSVDLHLFRHLASAARATADPLDAASLFDKALHLWRGEPFATLDTPWVNEVRTALEAERLSVELTRNDEALRAGRHAELLGELAAALQAHPLDERLAAQLVLAQYRSGRQADALDTYRRMRERLVEELGVDPTPPLRGVHQQILDGEPGVEAAPSLPVRTRPHAGPPRRATTFVGREQEVQHVTAALSEGPLVTLTGVGGVGKTRLALEAAGRAAECYGEDVWLCELAPLDDGAAVGHAVAATLRVQQQQGLGIEATVVDYLRAREMLLVVDNCEQVLDAAARLIDQIVRYCPRVSVLATSRESLGIEGERIVPVQPLPVDDATALFADRARAGRPDFDLDHEPIGAVAQICRRLDGLPLAIELAAARMRAMTSLDLARRLDRLRLLSGGARGAHPRQQSLAATIDWSYRLLAEPEQALFTRLSVFAGGFCLDAAHAVCGEDGATEDDTLELLTGLVDKSMVCLCASGGRSRFGVLETLRTYGRDSLQENEIDGLYATRHAVYFTELAERGAAGMYGADEGAWVERVLPDYDNLRAAFERAMAVPDMDLALRLITALPDLVQMRIGHESNGWAERAVMRAHPDHPLFAGAVGVAARGAWVLGDRSRARSLADLADGRVPGPGTSPIAYPADVLADLALDEGDAAAALAHYNAEAVRVRRTGDSIRLVWILYNVAVCHAALGTPDAAMHAAQEAMQVAAATGNPTAQTTAGYTLGRVLKEAEPDRAQALFDEAADLAMSVQNKGWYGLALMEAASIRAVQGDPAAAALVFVELLDHWGGVSAWREQWQTLRYVTRILVRLGAAEDAVALHYALIGTGQVSPLSAPELARLVDGIGEDRVVALTKAVVGGAAAVARARSALGRYC